METVNFKGGEAHISLDRYQSLLEAEKKLIDIKKHENEIINIPISQYWDLVRAKEESHDLKFPNIPSEPFPPESKIRATEQEFNCVIKGPVPIEEILNEREETHGKFEDHAAITDVIKFDMQQSSNWSTLGSMKREALDMIAHKIGRILAGNPNVKDHWDDIAGYAKLVSRELK
jgi:hypothetical protein